MSSSSPSVTTAEIPPRIPLGAYIFHRVRQLGISHVFGVPGDFNLNLLDHLDSIDSLKWVGACNELNGAYAADGYARLRGLPGVLITTYGVGELSALNGIAGAYCEHIPILHIVGTTPRLARKYRTMLHHTLGENWDHDTFQTMSEPVRCANAFLIDDATFTQNVDTVIEKCVKLRRPAYLYVPLDVQDVLVDSSSLSKPLDLEIRNEGKQTEEQDIIESILNMLNASRKPIVLADAFAHRYGAVQNTRELVELTNFPAYATPLGRSIIDETNDHFAGVYQGKVTLDPRVREEVESSDAVIHVGPLQTDTNTGAWTQKLDPQHHIFLGWDRIVVAGKRWDNIHFVPILGKLLDKIRSGKFPIFVNSTKRQSNILGSIQSPDLNAPLDQHHIWQQFNRFLRPGDCILAENGSAQCGTFELQLPSGCAYLSQQYYASIGYTVGALLGALIARRELGTDKSGRCILFIGDGSLQMTAQEISTIIRNNFTPTIILINNSGYTVERVIHGPSRQYNDIPAWNYQDMLSFFGATGAASYSYTARTYGELHAVLSDQSFASSNRIQLLEVILDKFDSPWTMTALVELIQQGARRGILEWDQQSGRERKPLDTNLWLSPDRLPVDGEHGNLANAEVIRRGFGA